MGGPAAERNAKSHESSSNRAASLGMKKYVNRCRCQGTLERKVFDKYIDDLDGCIRLRQVCALYIKYTPLFCLCFFVFVFVCLFVFFEHIFLFAPLILFHSCISSLFFFKRSFYLLLLFLLCVSDTSIYQSLYYLPTYTYV